ncbi:serine O-acetyltransferase EpsC [Xanthobacter autotrophicus]|uniref:serine O-acetyltransferase EpsC n=1 Tax=Xanthobacter autotrophicus TaxID=280 RepID=UPI003728E78B
MTTEAPLRETPRQKINADLARYAQMENVPANLKFKLRMFLMTPGFQFVFAVRLQELVKPIPVIGKALRRIIWWLSCILFSSEFALGAEVGGGLYVPHPFGIVVGAAKLGRNVTLLQNVTIGRKSRRDSCDPVIGDRVAIYSGAALLGSITIGTGSVIGANAVVVKDVPPGATAIGVPARIVPTPADPSQSPAPGPAVTG